MSGDGTVGLYRVEVTLSSGTGKLKPAGLDAIFDPRSFLTRTGVVFDRLEQLEF